jgi:hypothetical protein
LSLCQLQVEQAVLERLDLLYKFNCDIDDPWLLVKHGLIDPVKLFVKSEPHKIAKLIEGRCRLIFSMGLVDNLIARLLFSPQNVAEINNWKDIPLKPGMGLNDEGLQALFDIVRANIRGGILETDIKGWDWSFQELDFQEDLERRLFLNNGKGTLWEKIARSHYHCVARKVMCLSDGVMIKQLKPGVMPSGWYNTSSTNSAARALNHYHAALKENVVPWCITMGDDSVERCVPHLEDHYLELGKTCGLINEVDFRKFEFCSTLFVDGVGQPVNIDKQLVKILCSVPTDYFDAHDRYSQFMYELRHSPELDECLDLINSSGWWDKAGSPNFWTLRSDH